MNGPREADAATCHGAPDTERASPNGVEPGWWATVQNQIAESEYEIGWQEHASAYQSPNRAQNLRFTYWGDGFAAEPRTYEEDSPPWRLGLRLAAWGREDARRVFEAGQVQVDGNQAVAEGRGVTVTYQNDRRGMRQDFLVRERPSGSGPLRLWLDLELDGVIMEAEGDGRGLLFGRAVSGGARVMSYGDLEVRDAQGRLLQAEMVSQDERGFAIVVEDAGAIYPVMVDPLSSSPDWTSTGIQDWAFFGWSVATAGDVNGDGFSDVIVGACEYSNGQADEGRAFVYLGSPSGLATSPIWTAESDQEDAQFGYSVATAGDVNDDGYSDVIVGAPYFNGGDLDEGRAYVYLGGPSGLSPSPSWIAESDQAEAQFGISVATAGDVNGDGYSDVLVGAHWYHNGQSKEGRAFVYHGGPTGLAASPAWTAESDQETAGFGCSVACAGDVNGDGYSDVIIGARGYANDELAEGRAYVFHGSSSGLSASIAWSAESNQIGARFGVSVSSAGDVNGDGYSDVIIGAYMYDNGQNEEGRTFVYHGSAGGLSASANWTAESNQDSSYFGEAAASAGDIDGDGYGDVIVGARGYPNDEDHEGRVFVYRGGSSGLAASPAWIAENDRLTARFGLSVATAGDVNGDGYSDVIFGDPDQSQGVGGHAYVYHGSPAGLASTVGWTAESDQAGAHFGVSASSAGDVNGDGYGDVIIGAHQYDNGHADEGRAFVYHGGPSGLVIPAAWTAESNQAGANFGISVATAGDVNGDGYSDVIVGAYNFDNILTNVGQAYVYHGSPSGLEPSAAWAAGSFFQSYAYFGRSVACAGDVNGDGYSDVIVGSPGYNDTETDEGKAYVYHGSSAGLSGAPDWSAVGAQNEAYFGHAVAGAGDVNGDGYSDVIIGAYEYDNGQTNEGRAFVYHGGASGLAASADWTAEANLAQAYFGISVASAGDVDGDGYSDVIIGASQYDFGEGYAFLYCGGPAGLESSASWSAENDQLYDRFGYSVSSAGDVNGDGFSDVIIGAPEYSFIPADEGGAYMYLGSSSGLSSSPDWTSRSNQGSAEFGHSVATAGDVNGDGYSDVIVSAWKYDGGLTDEGRAYVWYGNDCDGLHVLPRQLRTDLITPVVPALRTQSESLAGLGLLARTFFGRSEVRVQFEVKPLGTPFDGSGVITGWLDPGTTGITVRRVIGGLSEDTMYKWRARVQYCLTDGAPQPYGRWIYQPYGGGLGEADFHVGLDDLTIPELHIDGLSATQCRLWWYTVADASIYRVYRDTTAFFMPDAPWQLLAAPDTSIVFTTGVGNPAINYYFLCRSLGAWGESENSNRVGEFDVDTSILTAGQEGRVGGTGNR